VIHVGDCAVAPVYSYGLAASRDGTVFSSILRVGTILRPVGKQWGDVVGSYNGINWTEPNRLVNVDDVVCWVKFTTLPSGDARRPHTTWLDLDGQRPNWIVNATDLQLILQAFASKTYPPSAFPHQGGPGECP